MALGPVLLTWEVCKEIHFLHPPTNAGPKQETEMGFRVSTPIQLPHIAKPESHLMRWGKGGRGGPFDLSSLSSCREGGGSRSEGETVVVSKDWISH